MVGCEMFGLMFGSILPSFVLPRDEQAAVPVERLQRVLVIEAGVVLLLVPCVYLFFRSEKSRQTRSRSASSEPGARKTSSSSSSNSMTSESKFVSLSQAERYACVTSLIEHTRDELRPQSDHSVCKQYRLLLRDSCYRYMLCAGSLSFCFPLCVHALLPLYLDVFGFDKVPAAHQSLAAYFSMGFLIAGLSAVGLLFMALSSKRQPELRGIAFLQLLAVLAHLLLLAGLLLTDVHMLLGALVLFGFSVFPSFSTVMVLIGRRVGSNFDLVATATLLYLAKSLALVFFAAVDFNYHATANKRRAMGISVLVLLCMSVVSLVCGLLSISHHKKRFLDE